MVKYVRNVKRARITRWWGRHVRDDLIRTDLSRAGRCGPVGGDAPPDGDGGVPRRRALEGLPECTRAFAEGRVGWSKLRAITRVATPESEGEWLSFAAAHTVEEVEAEVRDGMAKKRDRPRKDRHGLPNLEQRLLLKFTRSEMEKVRLGLGRLQEELAAKLGEDDIALRDLLLYACERLAAGGTAELDARAGEGALPYAVVYHRCPDCRASGMWTGEGLVEVDASEVDRIEGDAHVEHVEDAAPVRHDRPPRAERDRPTPPKLRRQVLLRDGLRCANPHCELPARHCHHIVFREDGGATELGNEVALCTTCHALVHAGLLEVTGRPGEDLRWKAVATTFDRDLPARTAGALPVIQLPSGDPDKGTVSGRPDESPASGCPDGAPPLPQDVTRDVIHALKKHFGFDKETARRDLLRAAAELPAGQCGEQDLIQAALEYRRERNRAPVQRARDVRVAPHPHLPAHVHRAGRPRRPVAAL
jgi:5-methylcytosine-specific restriction endonuclease McrA